MTAKRPVRDGIFLLALDAGTGGGRALISDARGNTRAETFRAWEFAMPLDPPGASEFDPAVLWHALAAATREALARSDILPASVRGISATSFRDGALLLDRAGQPLLCFSNRDGRAVAEGAQIAAEHGALIHRVAGRLPFGLELLEHLVWTRAHRAEIFDRVAHALLVGDWLTFQLCGELVAEPTNASSSLLFDIHQRAWSREIADALELALNMLPPLAAPGQIAGSLSTSAAQALGLEAGIPVAVGGGDSPLACLGCGALDAGAVVIVAGTTIPVLMVHAAPPFDATRRLWAGAHPLPARWVLESNGGPAGVAYQWARATLYPHDDYAVMEQEAAHALPGLAHAFFGARIADFARVGFPPPLALIFPAPLGFGPTLTRGQLARTVMENIACAGWANVQQLVALSGQSFTALHLCGGMARSALFAQIVADVANCPVRVSGTRDATALGAAMCAAVGAGIYPDLRAAAEAMSRAVTVVPDDAGARKYRGVYRKWVDTLKKVEGI